MKKKSAKNGLALSLLLVLLTLPMAGNAIGQEKKTRPEPPGPDPMAAPAKKKVAKKQMAKQDPKKTETKAEAKDSATKKNETKNTENKEAPQRTGNWYIRQSPQLLKAFEPIAQNSAGTTVKVLANIKKKDKEEEGQVSLGTVIDAAGFIVTKASQIHSKAKTLKIEINGKKVPATVFGIHERADLAMLKIEPAGLELKPIEWQNQTPEVGYLLATPNAEAKTIGFGVLSVASREERDTRGFMGVRLEDVGEGEKGSVITEVTPKSPAAYAGLRVGDMILSVDGKEVENTPDLIGKVSKRKSGETVKIKLVRDKKEVEKAVKLGDRTSMGLIRLNPQETIARNRLSARRTGFDQVIQHDTVLSPEQMGGPLLDLEGRAIGLNIAKNGRVSTYALPLAILQPAIAEMRSGKLSPALVHKPKIDQLTALISEKEEAIKKSGLKEKADSASEKLKAAKEAFEKAEKEYARLQKELEEAGKEKFRKDEKHKESHSENRRASRAYENARKEIEELKKEKKALENTYK